jgi:signal transduction histidine kinase
MGRLVKEMLVLARADAGQLRMNKQKLDLRVVATDVLHSFGPGLVADIQDSPVMIGGDADHLQRALSNLIENALRYSSAGGSVKVSVCSDGNQAYLKVADTGEGIAPEHLPHVTERFYRADTSRARADGGAGLGLAICKTIAEAHGGTLEIESTLGSGTIVTIRLPSL